jgi:hypothetical protein
VREVNTTLSMRQPVPATDSSLPIRQRSTMSWPATPGGRFTVVVTKPPDDPLQAALPASGLVNVVLIVAL